MARTRTVLRQLRRLRKRVQAAKAAGHPLDLDAPHDYLYLVEALELLIGAIETEAALKRARQETL